MLPSESENSTLKPETHDPCLLGMTRFFFFFNNNNSHGGSRCAIVVRGQTNVVWPQTKGALQKMDEPANCFLVPQGSRRFHS